MSSEPTDFDLQFLPEEERQAILKRRAEQQQETIPEVIEEKEVTRQEESVELISDKEPVAETKTSEETLRNVFGGGPVVSEAEVLAEKLRVAREVQAREAKRIEEKRIREQVPKVDVSKAPVAETRLKRFDFDPVSGVSVPKRDIPGIGKTPIPESAKGTISGTLFGISEKGFRIAESRRRTGDVLAAILVGGAAVLVEAGGGVVTAAESLAEFVGGKDVPDIGAGIVGSAQRSFEGTRIDLSDPLLRGSQVKFKAESTKELDFFRERPAALAGAIVGELITSVFLGQALVKAARPITKIVKPVVKKVGRKIKITPGEEKALGEVSKRTDQVTGFKPAKGVKPLSRQQRIQIGKEKIPTLTRKEAKGIKNLFGAPSRFRKPLSKLERIRLGEKRPGLDRDALKGIEDIFGPQAGFRKPLSKLERIRLGEKRPRITPAERQAVIKIGEEVKFRAPKTGPRLQRTVGGPKPLTESERIIFGKEVKRISKISPRADEARGIVRITFPKGPKKGLKIGKKTVQVTKQIVKRKPTRVKPVVKAKPRLPKLLTDPAFVGPKIPSTTKPRPQIPGLKIPTPTKPKPRVPTPTKPAPQVPILKIPTPVKPKIPAPTKPRPQIPVLKIPTPTKPRVPTPTKPRPPTLIPVFDIPTPTKPTPPIPGFDIPTPTKPKPPPQIPVFDIPTKPKPTPPKFGPVFRIPAPTKIKPERKPILDIGLDIGEGFKIPTPTKPVQKERQKLAIRPVSLLGAKQVTAKRLRLLSPLRKETKKRRRIKVVKRVGRRRFVNPLATAEQVLGRKPRGNRRNVPKFF